MISILPASLPRILYIFRLFVYILCIYIYTFIYTSCNERLIKEFNRHPSNLISANPFEPILLLNHRYTGPFKTVSIQCTVNSIDLAGKHFHVTWESCTCSFFNRGICNRCNANWDSAPHMHVACMQTWFWKIQCGCSVTSMIQDVGNDYLCGVKVWYSV